MTTKQLQRTTFSTSRLLDFARRRSSRPRPATRWTTGRLSSSRSCSTTPSTPARRPASPRKSRSRSTTTGSRQRQRSWPAGQDDRGRARLLDPGELARGVLLPNPRRPRQRAQNDRRHAVRARDGERGGSRSRLAARAIASPSRSTVSARRPCSITRSCRPIVIPGRRSSSVGRVVLAQSSRTPRLGFYKSPTTSPG